MGKDRVRSKSAAATDRLAKTVISSSEAIAVVDRVGSTATSNVYGWNAVGRDLFRDLQGSICRIGRKHGLTCFKSTGDGCLIGYACMGAADVAAVHAVNASRELLSELAKRNRSAPEERQIHVRVGVHFGEVDVVPDDREGPNVTYAFRIGSITRAVLPHSLAAIDPGEFPHRNYVLCSETVAQILAKREPNLRLRNCGSYKLKGFAGRWDVYLVTAGTIATGRRRRE